MAEIHTATERGRTSQVKELLAADAALVDLRSDLGDQPLHSAARHGRSSIAKMLLDCGADINARDERGQTALHLAVMEQKPKFVELLISRGADPTIEDVAGLTPLYLAASTRDQPMIDTLQENRVPVDARSLIYLDSPDRALTVFEKSTAPLSAEKAQQILLDAIRVGSTELLKFLFRHGADANKMVFNSPPLLEAVSHHRENIVRDLLERGANVNVKDHIGRPILQFCQTYGAPEGIVSLLRQAGATE